MHTTTTIPEPFVPSVENLKEIPTSEKIEKKTRITSREINFIIALSGGGDGAF